MSHSELINEQIVPLDKIINRILTRPESPYSVDKIPGGGVGGFVMAMQVKHSRLQIESTKQALRHVLNDPRESGEAPYLELVLNVAENRFDRLNREIDNKRTDKNFADGYNFGLETIDYCFSMLRRKGFRIDTLNGQLEVIGILQDPDTRIKTLTKYSEPDFATMPLADFFKFFIDLNVGQSSSGNVKRFLSDYRPTIFARLLAERWTFEAIDTLIERLSKQLKEPVKVSQR